MPILLALGLMLSFASWSYAAPPACTHWASSGGTGNTCSESAPCKVSTWLGNQAGPGKVLCLADGHYKGDDSMLSLSARSGTAGSPITVRAANDGKVLIDGEFQRRPLDCAASYITVIGVNVRDGNDNSMTVRGQHCTIQRVMAWSTQREDGIENIIDVGGNHNLLEDIAAWGFARKMIAAGARGGTGPNTIRRAWAEHNGTMPGSAQGNPSDPIELGYNQDNVTYENVIGRRNILSQATEPEAPLHIFSTRGSAMLGSIVYAKNTDSFDTDMLFNVTPESGSHAGSGEHSTSNTLVQDMVLLAGSAHEQIVGFRIDGGQGSTGNRAKNIVSVAPAGGGRCQGDGWECTNLFMGTSLEQALGNKKIYEAAPGTCFRYVNRVLTTEPLWPWPLEQRIAEALGRARIAHTPVQADIEGVFGTVPAQCVSGTAPKPPNPSVQVPVPPTNVQAAMQGTGVLVSWVDTQGSLATGYTLERKVGTQAYRELTTAPGATARSYTDATPGTGQNNCYVVYARGDHGPSGLSSEACVQVPGTPVPPEPDRQPFTCEGSIGAGNVISMVCNPVMSKR
jgi:hypothetical protein